MFINLLDLQGNLQINIIKFIKLEEIKVRYKRFIIKRELINKSIIKEYNHHLYNIKLKNNYKKLKISNKEQNNLNTSKFKSLTILKKVRRDYQNDKINSKIKQILLMNH